MPTPPPPNEEEELLAALRQVMPFGKYSGSRLIDIPEPYLVWFHQKGFPPGKLGAQLELIYEVKLNGLDAMMRKLLQENDHLP